jgi:hypothetical protein
VKSTTAKAKHSVRRKLKNLTGGVTVKTIKQVKKEHETFTCLIENVLIQLGILEDTRTSKTVDMKDPDPDDMIIIQDIVNHGIDGGFNGFIYYSDTVMFYDLNKEDIDDLVKEIAEESGVGLLEFIHSFRCLHKEYTIDEIGQIIYGDGANNHEINEVIKNALSWFAAEEVCSWFED